MKKSCLNLSLFCNEIGWQAGNGDINFRGVAIVFDGDFTAVSPSEKMIEGAKALIKKEYEEREG